jgi:anaerobic selenocysteine-containing dehydrogenase
VTNLDWRGGAQRQATPGRNAAPLDAIDRAQAIVIIGAAPEERAPVLWLRVHKAVLRSGAKIVRASSAQEARSAAGDAKRVALIWDGVDLEVGRSYAEAFAGAGELSTYIASEQANARGAEAMGMLPSQGPGVLDGVRDGTFDVLSILGANPARNAPDAAAVAAALERVPFLVVSELFLTETAQRAALILPAKGAFEKIGTTLGMGGTLLPVNASLEAPDFVLSDEAMLRGLADQLGASLPSAEALQALVVDRAANAASDFTFGDGRFALRQAQDDSGAAHGNGAPVAPILSGGGTWQHDPWLAGLRT